MDKLLTMFLNASKKKAASYTYVLHDLQAWLPGMGDFSFDLLEHNARVARSVS
jgi:hypothetical protein